MDSDLLLFLSSLNTNYNWISPIIENYNTLEDIIYDNAKKLLEVDPKIYEFILKNMKKFDINLYKEKLWKNSIKFTTYGDSKYPKKLLEIDDAPYTLYYKGDLTEEFDNCISFVGARKCSQYGSYACKKFVSEISQYKIPVVSGLALGIDKISHQTALENNNKTIGVLGCGIDQIYPRSNYRVFQDMINSHNGVIMSEYPFGIAPLPYNFPFRNRIISGLSLATVVIEAKEKSGTLITSSYALSQGRDIFAVPGNINSVYSTGTNQLIKDGAYLLTDVLDIITQIPQFQSKYIEKPQLSFDLNELENKIFNLLKVNSNSPDEISLKLNEDISDVLMSLTKMELLGIVVDIGSKYSLK